MMDSVEFLGHRVDAEGLPEKKKAVEQAPLPKNVHQLRSFPFLGLMSQIWHQSYSL
jgi:hypothetical protein